MAQELITKRLNFKNKVVIITGGSGGIGAAITKAFLEAEASVILIGRDKFKLKNVWKNFGSIAQGGFIVSEVKDANKMKKVLAQVVKKYGKIDIVVNCAGIYGPIGEFHTNSLKEWVEALQINLLGTINTSYAALPFMIKQKRGKIINLSGGGAVQPFPNFSSYATAKAGIVRFTETLAKEYEKYNIQINAVAPGAINSTFLDKVLKAGTKAGKDFLKKSLQQKKSGGDSPELAAELVLFLADFGNKLTGKLVSAKWDPWREITTAKIQHLNESNDYTLRRIDNKYFKEIN